MKKGLLFVLSGPSGTGKGTVCNELLKQEDNLYLSVSMTSRDVRDGEIPGVTYNYTTPENFKKMAESGQMLEWAQYGKNYYGTPKKEVMDKINSGMNVLLEIEVQGALKVKAEYDDAILMFIAPPSMDELKRRLETRGRESMEEIQKRIETAEFEFSKVDNYDYVLINDDLDECVKNVRNVMKSEEFKTKHSMDFIDSLRK